LVSANQQSSGFRPVSRGANITADYKQLRFISSEKAREWMRATVDGLIIILCIVERVHLSFHKTSKWRCRGSNTVPLACKAALYHLSYN